MKIHFSIHSFFLLATLIHSMAVPCHAETSAQATPAATSDSAAPEDVSGLGETSDASLDSGMNHGPHAGFMRGKGPVQAELLLGPGSGFRLFFVDAQWIDIPLKDSKLEVLLERQGSSVTPLRCVPKPSVEQPNFFICELPKSAILASGDCIFVRFTLPSGKDQTFNFTFPFTEQEGRKPFPEVKQAGEEPSATPEQSSKPAPTQG